MAQHSAGILLYRWAAGEPQVFLVHPGGPFWAKKDEGAWSIPKGLCEAGEDMRAAACREFEEETGMSVSGTFIELGEFRQPGGKRIHAWAVEGDIDPAVLRSNEFALQWPPGSGRRTTFPEVDRGEWFGLEQARAKILKGQRPMIESFRNSKDVRREQRGG